MRLRWQRCPHRGFVVVTTCVVSVILLFVQLRNYPGSLAGEVEKDTGESSASDSHKDDRIAFNDRDIDDKVTEALKSEIEAMKIHLRKKMAQLSNIRAMKKDEKISLLQLVDYPSGDAVTQYIQSQVKNAYVLRPNQYRNEYAIPPFSTFTRKSILRLELGLMKQPEVILPFYTDIQADLLEVLEKGASIMKNSDIEFVEGFYRTQYKVGTQYELTYRSTVNASAPVHLVTLFRPFAPIHTIAANVRDPTEVVHVIVPLQGRGDSFRRFMDNFESEAITGDGHIHLTVVCYGEEALTDAKEILWEIKKKLNFDSFQIVEGQRGEFSRGRALQEGSTNIPGDDRLMFFCDVDIFFTSHFLSQCRSQTKPGSKVFYPIVFSLYNPAIVYKGKAVPSLRDQQVIRRDNGFWRDFGFGMTCQYNRDFNEIGGFDLTIKGWGSEDVLLYRKYTRSQRHQVVRSPVDSLFHHWHAKHCDKSLSLEQYNACLRTRSLTEGSQIQLGMLYLKDQEGKK